MPKDTIAKLLFQGIRLLPAQQNLIKVMQGQTHVLNIEAISCQSTMIKLQEELISVKDNQVGPVAQMVEHPSSKREDVGSYPTRHGAGP